MWESAQSLSCVQLFATQAGPRISFQDFPGKNIGAGCPPLLQGIFPTQGSDPQLLCLPHQQADSLPLHHLGSPPTSLLGLKTNLAPHPTLLHSFAQIKGTTQTYKAPRSELQIPCRQKPVGFICALSLHWPDQQWLGAESKGPQSTFLGEGKWCLRSAWTLRSNENF